MRYIAAFYAGLGMGVLLAVSMIYVLDQQEVSKMRTDHQQWFHDELSRRRLSEARW